jgi:hypothetical protein
LVEEVRGLYEDVVRRAFARTLQIVRELFDPTGTM